MTPIEPTCIKNLMDLANAYAEAKDISLSTVGRYIHGTASFFQKLDNGDITVSARTYDSLVGRFEQQWPKGAPWPKIQKPFKPRRA